MRGPKHPKRTHKKRLKRAGRKIRKGTKRGAKVLRKGGKTVEQVAPVAGAMTGYPEAGKTAGEIGGHAGKIGHKSRKLLK